MSKDLLKALITQALDDLEILLYQAVDEECVAAPVVLPTTHLVLVSYYNQPVWADYLAALHNTPGWIDSWLAPQGLEVTNWAIHHAAVPGNPGSYHLSSLVRELQKQDLCVFDGKNAWYLFSQDPARELVLYGTIGGDWFGQTEGQEGNRVPGVSMFMVQGLHALAYNETHPAWGSTEIWPRDKALGCIAHELGHNLGVLPCADCSLHDSSICIMTSRLYSYPSCEFEDGGALFGCKAGNERLAMKSYGFMRSP